jgi:GNAT superfamily N-acetyltransferase
MIELLSKELDKNGKEINICRVDKISMSPVYTFFLRQIADLIDNRHAYPVSTWNDSCGAIYAEENGNILGHIVYDANKADVLWIVLSAVDEDHRGRGIYTILHRYFEKTAKELNFNFISSHIHINNTVRLKSAEKVGMKPVYYYMAKKI